MRQAQWVDASEMARHVFDGATVVLSGSGGGLQEPDRIAAAIEQRFLETGHPRNLTLVHALGIGDGRETGISRFAHKGMVRRVIGGHWTWSKRMQNLALHNEIEAYTLPAGPIQTLLRETGAGRHGLVTHIGLHTFADPRHGGGRCNVRATEELVEVIQLGGKELLWYKPIHVDFALVRGTAGDPLGNLTSREEPADMDGFAAAMAAHNCGGMVFAQVRDRLDEPIVPAREVSIPGIFVDFVCCDPQQRQTTGAAYDLTLAGREHPPADREAPPLPEGIRYLIARRAAHELVPGKCINFGFGVPDGIPAVARAEGLEIGWTTIEQGPHNGELLGGHLFGATRWPSAIVKSTEQFDFFSGGGVDIAFLGMGEMDAQGNVNVSWLGENIVGPGGFVDITQRAKKVVFCGSFEAKGLEVEQRDGRVHILRHGSVPKIVPEVRHITFSGQRARADEQKVIYVTERAVFELQHDGLTLIEIAEGIDLQKDVLDRLGFEVRVDANLRTGFE
ncbi:MAG: acyl CoA:acetate/3-ketoacid CoA transferase [Burkholderiales bacterium]|nr:acyl CoA:acetate/3-ketoacid CoA transferase [Burkholderiales bacterium]MDE2398056.1 acyl CoA:acetate/3-ketoacid CoA transferase [Burkholderiales bacterium]MDE2455458.1 acyl CoA:acetate/3-ketoacid CoA transferase [Burkholderiales bacterium]